MPVKLWLTEVRGKLGCRLGWTEETNNVSGGHIIKNYWHLRGIWSFEEVEEGKINEFISQS